MNTKKRAKISFTTFIAIPIFMIGIFLILLLFVGKKCTLELEKNDTTFIEQIGRDLSDVKKEFEKGLNYVDSTKVDNDTLNIKK